MVPLVISPEVVPPVQDDPSSRIPFGYTEGAASQGVFEVFFLPFLESRRVSGPPSMVAVATQFPHKYGLGALGRDAELRGTDNFHGLDIGLGPATGPTGVFVAVLFPVPPDGLEIVIKRLRIGGAAVLELGLGVELKSDSLFVLLKGFGPIGGYVPVGGLPHDRKVEQVL